ncbi:MAG: hypothetical protein JSV62_09365 [Promethearchaeota archaeon]|nr:MAG: hypothetical protein JSV62_09365 [Candidatus Lokiarchaeota archaeon]
MALKDKVWIIALVSAILSLVGWATPYIWTWVGTIHSMIWSWGLIFVTASGIWFIMQIMVAGIFIIISAISILVTGILSKKRENLKKMGLIWLVAGILSLLGVFTPLLMGIPAFGLSIGFYLPLFGGIIAIIAGIIALYVS